MGDPARRKEPSEQDRRRGHDRRRRRRSESANWMVCTVLQGLLTWVFWGLSKLSEGWPWEGQAKLLVLMAIVATWCMALRTIRARILELLRFWRMPLKEVPGVPSGMPDPVEKAVERFRAAYTRESVWRLRLIAAGISIPFYVMPFFVSAACIGMCWERNAVDGDFLGLALVLSILAAVAGAYFYWSTVPDSALPGTPPSLGRGEPPAQTGGGASGPDGNG
jgi:hypothetical protein